MADLWRTIAERHGELLSALGQHIEISLIALILAVVIADRKSTRLNSSHRL